MTDQRRPDLTGQIDILGIPGADNRLFASQGQARNAALAAANQMGLGYSIAHDPRPQRGLPHYHVVSPTGRRISGHYFYGRRAPRKVLSGRPWREFEAELELAAESMARRGKTRTMRKKSRDVLANQQRRVDELRARLQMLNSLPNKTREIKEEIARAQRAYDRAVEQLRASENHAQRSQRPSRI